MKQRLQFTKMHGLGNDFILVDAIGQRIDLDRLPEMAKRLCDRNFGIGADGLITVLRSEKSDLRMRIINPDGSEPEMCGNGIRCFAKYVYDQKLIEKDVFSVETEAGIMIPALVLEHGQVSAVEVDMGEPVLARDKIPMVGSPDEQVVSESLSVNGDRYDITLVSMGNPHAVVFHDDIKSIDLDTLGPLFEHHEVFPQRINTEFVQVLSPSEAVMVVWERGAGETLACGTGACATLVAGVLNGKLDRKALIHLPGGDLSVEWSESDRKVMMTGPAQTVFSGTIWLD